MGRKRQKEPELKLVAPEPPGDECEANLQWDHVSALGAAPAFFDGTHTAASVNVFDVDYDVDTTRGGQPQRGALLVPRAVEQFTMTEQELLAMRERAAETVAALHDLTALATAEGEVASAEKSRLERATAAAVQELELVTHDARAAMRTAMEAFHADRATQIGHLTELILQDGAIESAFNEREAMLRERDRVVEAYFTEHSAHVTKMERLQTESATTRQATLDAMVATLLKTAEELTATTMHRDADRAMEDRRSQLITELLQLERESRGRVRRRADICHSTAELRRLIDLERQKAQLAAERNELLRRQVDMLQGQTDECGALTADSSDASRAAVTFEPSFVPEEGQADGAGAGEPDVMNEIADVRRQLDAVTTEVAYYQDRLQRLRRQHYMQQNSQYTVSDSAVKVTQSYVDAETAAVVRDVVRAAMLELEEALRCTTAAAAGTSQANSSNDSSNSGGSTVARRLRASTEDDKDVDEAPLARLSEVQSVAERQAIQNYVARRINDVLGGSYPMYSA